MEATYEQWLASRPTAVQQRAKEYPPMTRLLSSEGVAFVIGYSEEEDGRVGLWVTAIDPRGDFYRAFAERRRVCAHHLSALAEMERAGI